MERRVIGFSISKEDPNRWKHRRSNSVTQRRTSGRASASSARTSSRASCSQTSCRGERPRRRPSGAACAEGQHTDRLQNPAKLRRFRIGGGDRGRIIRNFRKVLHFGKIPKMFGQNSVKIQQKSVRKKQMSQISKKKGNF